MTKGSQSTALDSQEGLKLPNSRQQHSEEFGTPSAMAAVDVKPQALSVMSTSTDSQAEKQYFITDAQHYTYKLPLSQQLTSDASQTHREGLILKLSIGQSDKEAKADNRQSFAAYGEIAPLPGIPKFI